MSNSSTPEEEKEISKLNFESDEGEEQPAYPGLSFCRFVERFECFVISIVGCIHVILSTECIVVEVYKLLAMFWVIT
jgi:hypothetical protein